MFTDAELTGRGMGTLIASWREYARGSTGASLHRLRGVVAAVFPREPERDVYNNALLSRDLPPAGRTPAIDAMQSAYAGAGVTRFAAWVSGTDDALRAELERRGYRLDTTTRAMSIELDTLPAAPAGETVPNPIPEVRPASWAEYLRYERLPPDFLAGTDHAALHVLAVREEGEVVAAALAYDHSGDCGIYNVGTVQWARRRGLGSAVTLAQLSAARIRGCRTASLQATPMAERLYARLGFRDLGQILEYVPPA